VNPENTLNRRAVFAHLDNADRATRVKGAQCVHSVAQCAQCRTVCTVSHRGVKTYPPPRRSYPQDLNADPIRKI